MDGLNGCVLECSDPADSSTAMIVITDGLTGYLGSTKNVCSQNDLNVTYFTNCETISHGSDGFD